MRTLIIVTFACLFWSTVQAMPAARQSAGVTLGKDMPASLEGQSQDQTHDWWRHLAENTPETTPETPKPPESGSLIIPGEDEGQKEKKCLNVDRKSVV